MGNKLRMLVADHVEISRILFKNIFANEYHIVESDNGQHVLNLLSYEKFNLIVLNLELPDIDVFQLLETIKSDPRYQYIPIVIITSEESPEHQIHALELGADEFFVQPFDLQILKYRIDNLVKKSERIRCEYETELEIVKNDLKILTDTIKDGLAELFVKNKVILKRCNTELCELLGYSEEELTDNETLDFVSLIRKSDINRFWNIVKRAKKNNRVFCAEINFIKKNGSTIRLGLSINFIRKDTERNEELYFVMFSDRTQQRKIKEQLKDMMDHLLYQAEKDDLTGLYNRVTFMEKAQDRLAQLDAKFVIAALRIDGFKAINTLYGSETAKSVLTECASFIADKLNRTGLYGRLEQDQFVCLLPKDLVVSHLEEIDHVLKTGFIMKSINYPITMHAGFYDATENEESIDTMCNMALLTANSIKNNYLKRWKFFDDKLKEKIEEEQALVGDMEYALKNNQFILNLQPIFDSASGKIICAEALVRWKHPQKGIISPNIFIPLFERNGFVTKLDTYVWEMVLKLLSENQKKGIPNIPISVNISRISCYNKFLDHDFEMLLEKYQIDSSLLRLEISQQAYLDEPEQLLDTIRKLRQKGFEVVLDNFGAEQSSLNVLRDVPMDILKVNIQFLEEIKKSKKASYIMSNIVSMAKKLQIMVIAERVETKNQYDFLIGIGCDLMQGYYFSRPVSTDKYRELVLNKDNIEIEKLDTSGTGLIKPALGTRKKIMQIKDAQTLKQQWFNVLDSDLIAVARIKIDLQDPKMHGRYLYTNHYYCVLHGLDEQDLQKEAVDIYLNFVDEDEVQALRKFRDTLMSGNEFIQNICNLRLSSGKIVSVLINGTVCYEANGMVQVNIIEFPIWSENEDMMVKIIDNVLDDLLTNTNLYCWRYDIVNNAYIYKSGQLKNNGMPNYIQGVDEKFLPGHCYLKEDYDRVHTMYEKIRHGEPLVEEVFHMYRMDDPKQFVWIKIIYKTLFNQKKEPIMAIGLAENITVEKDLEKYRENEKISTKMLKEAQQQISILNSLALEARMDIMTGCMNRSYFEQAVCEYGELHLNELHAFYMLDIDNFKTVNDTLGHDVGDLVLKTLSQQMMRIFGVGNLFGRIGGDEFAALVITADRPDRIERFAKDICNTISMHLEKGGKRVFVSCSLGICVACEGKYEFNTLYTGADEALYKAKNAGKNRYQIIYL